MHCMVIQLGQPTTLFLFAGLGVELWIAKTRQSRFVRANFHTGKTVKSFHVVDAADSQVTALFGIE